jgi:RNA polymerase sigma-70 factor (ECF subfamily)
MAYRQLGNAADAEDAVQDALLSAYTHLDQFKGQALMSTWLTAIVTNSSRTHLRKRLRQTHLPLDERFGEEQEYCMSERLADCGPSPEDECIQSELHERLMQAVAELPPSLRRAFQLRDLNGLTTSEAAHILGVAEGTVKAELSRARTMLRRRMRRALDIQPRSAQASTSLPGADAPDAQSTASPRSDLHCFDGCGDAGSNYKPARLCRAVHDIAMEHHYSDTGVNSDIGQEL